MAIKSQFTQVDRNSGKTVPSKTKGKDIGKSGGPSRATSSGPNTTGKAGGMRYGDTQSSMIPLPKFHESQPVQPRPQQPFQTAGGAPGVANSGIAGAASSPYNVAAGVDSPWNVNPAPLPSGSTMGGASATNTYQGVGGNSPYGYTPAGFKAMYDSPQLQTALAQDVLAGLGVDNYGLAQSVADAFYPALYAFMMTGQGLGDVSDQATMDYITQYLTNFTTPGGQMPDFAQMVGNLLGAGDPGSSPLAMSLSSVPPEQQVKEMAQYLAAAGYGNNPLAQEAYRNAADYYGTQYLADTYKGGDAANSYAQFLRNSPLRRWIR